MPAAATPRRSMLAALTDPEVRDLLRAGAGVVEKQQ
jgi:hypothetical protein